MEYLTTEAAAARLGVTRLTARRMAKRGDLPGSIPVLGGGKRGEIYAIPSVSVDLVLERRKGGAAEADGA